MAEVTRQRTGEMLRAVFGVLMSHPDGLPARQVLAEAEKALTVTEFEASDYPSTPGVRRFEKLIRFLDQLRRQGRVVGQEQGHLDLGEDVGGSNTPSGRTSPPRQLDAALIGETP